MIMTICPQCKTEFTPKKKGKKFCSSECYHASHSLPRGQIECEACRQPFFGIIGKSRFCCVGCVNTAFKSKQKIEKVCIQCNAHYFVNPSYASASKFCSKECFHRHLRDGSEGEVEIKCENCGKSRRVPYIHRTKRFCNHSCASSGEFNWWHGVTGPDHPMFGRPAWNKGLTKDVDPRLFELGRKISEYAKKQFEEGHRSNEGELNPNFGRTPDTRTPEQLENYSKAAIKRIQDGLAGRSSKFFKSGFYTSIKTGEEMFYRSSYELRFMKCLDLDESVTDYIYEPFSIKIMDGRRYIPDFLVSYNDGNKKLFEVKPAVQLNDESVVKKSEAAKQYYAELGIMYEMVTLSDIEELESRLVQG